MALGARADFFFAALLVAADTGAGVAGESSAHSFCNSSIAATVCLQS